MVDSKKQSQMLEKIMNTKAEDFDGHTDFQKLTAKQKLIWISSTAYFLYTISKNNPHLGSARFFEKKPGLS